MTEKDKSKNKEQGIYLLVVDTTEEFSVAVDYACKFAKAHEDRVALLSVMELGHVENWQNIAGRTDDLGFRQARDGADGENSDGVH
jgi:hypothetical protein